MFKTKKELEELKQNIFKVCEKLEQTKRAMTARIEGNEESSIKEIGCKLSDIGFYNGVEFALSVLEGREAERYNVEEEEKEEMKAGRTVASGKIIRK